MAAKGGVLMLVLLLLSLAAIYIFGQKLWLLHGMSRSDREFMDNIRSLIRAGKADEALGLCQSTDSPSARMVRKGLERVGRPLSDVKDAIENTGNIEVARLEKGLPMLATIAGGAPMIGFLGTVIGMVQAFYNMSAAGSNVDINLLSDGIYTAMITTVGGLIVGIIAYFGYNYLTSRISDIVFGLENATMEFMDLLEEKVEK